MNADLSEDEMRQALFGSSNSPVPSSRPSPQQATVPAAEPKPKLKPSNKLGSPKLRVTLHVTKEFEGTVEILTHDANTLSTFVAEQEAKALAKKKKYKYIDVVSVRPI